MSAGKRRPAMKKTEIPRDGDITTVRELIAVLETLPPDSQIVICEDDGSDIGYIESIAIGNSLCAIGRS